MATREEAPLNSWAQQIWSVKYQRYIHCLSQVEGKLAFLAMFHPQVFAIHEQRALSAVHASHPLWNHPKFSEFGKSSTQGTLAIFESLGELKRHPTVAGPGKDGQPLVFPFPYQGDFLLFLNDSSGVWCVNWSVKAEQSGFDVPFGDKSKNAKAIEKLKYRNLVEKLYYAEMNIPTFQLSAQSVDPTLLANLRLLALEAKGAPKVCERNFTSMVCQFEKAMTLGESPNSIAIAFCSKFRCTRQEMDTILAKAIVERRLRVDLFHKVQPDEPFSPERIDPVAKYANLFGGARI